MKMINDNRSVILVALVLTCLCVFLFHRSPCEAQRHAIFGPTFGTTGVTRDGWKWTTEQWDGNDQQYQRIRSHIDGLATRGVDLQQLAQSYKATADANEGNPKAQFAWAYATWVAARSMQRGGTKFLLLQDIPEALAVPKSPHSYEYARMRFLVQAWFIHKPQLRPVGMRLLAQNPYDDEVKSELVSTYIPIRTLQEKKVALDYLHQLVAGDPSKASYQALYGCIYMTAYENFKQTEDADNAIAYLQSYMRMSSHDDFFRPTATQLIQHIEQMKTNPKHF